jgi:phosphomannomutase
MYLAIVSVSGIRGVVNRDIDEMFAISFGVKFGNFLHSGSVAIAADTRKTAPLMKNAIVSGLILSGCTVFDLGYSSTPSVFKEVAVKGLDGGIIVTSSHNPPEWNGIKFVIRPGRGVFESELNSIESASTNPSRNFGRIFPSRASYVEILRNKAGKDSATGVKVALDLAGGVGSLFIPKVVSYQGSIVHTIHSAPGIFPRIIDPTADPLILLSDLVTSAKCDVGFAYDCDADRLVIVDEHGRKLSGDATLLICLRYFLENTRNRQIVVSVDTSLSAEDLVREFNGKIIYSKVGEPNVVQKILENNSGAGGEGSSGGYIEPSFVMCRDGVYASTMILKLIKSEGSLSKLLRQFPEYHQDRGKVEIDRKLTGQILETLAATEREPDQTDGLKIRMDDKSWVLIRGSNTENVIRVSAEAKSSERAKSLVSDYVRKINALASEVQKQPLQSI